MPYSESSFNIMCMRQDHWLTRWTFGEPNELEDINEINDQFNGELLEYTEECQNEHYGFGLL